MTPPDINYSDLPIKSTPSVPWDYVIITDSEDWDIVKIQDATQFKWPDWTSIVWKGDYSNSTTYQVNDAVIYNTKTYICTATTTWNLPTNTSYWDIMVDNGGTILPTYTITNPTTDRAIDLSNMTLNELANVVWTLIEDIESGLKWPQWDTGIWISSITLISGTHAPWTLDTYRVTYTDLSTFDFQVYNGADGADWQWVPTWWTAWQVLAKIDWTDFNTEWIDQSLDINWLTEDAVWDSSADYIAKYDGTNKKIKVIKYMASDAEALAWTNETKYINPKQGKDNYALVTDSVLFTRVLSTGTWTVNYSHSLGKAPKAIIFSVVSAWATGWNWMNHWAYSATTSSNKCTYTPTDNWNQTADRTKCLVFSNNAASAYNNAYVSAVSSTDFTLTWTKVWSPTWTYNILAFLMA